MGQVMSPERSGSSPRLVRENPPLGQDRHHRSLDLRDFRRAESESLESENPPLQAAALFA